MDTKTNKHIYILITIDTDRLRREFPTPSQDPKTPTGIQHNNGYMVATGREADKQGTGDLVVNAQVGDTVNFWATCPSNNFNDAVLLYGVPKSSGIEVLGPREYVKLERETVAPGHTKPLPPVMEKRNFQFYRAAVVRQGKEGYNVQFALYNRNAAGTPVLYGYFYWDPTIVVKH